ncbi:MAG: DUF308 domain-containing protein [Bacilli bacterium]|nr:DUF308 domain-containing protein [Bacilli bacterium]
MESKKAKNILNIGVSIILILMGVFLLVFPLFGSTAPNRLLYILFIIYGGIKTIEYILTRNEKDYEDLYTGIACLLAAASGIKFVSYTVPLVLSITLFSWVGIMAIIKLIKLDYYHDRDHLMFYVNLVTFSLFILLGLLTCINLYYELSVQILILGFFFVINGLLNLAEDGIRILIDNFENIKRKRNNN